MKPFRLGQANSGADEHIFQLWRTSTLDEQRLNRKYQISVKN